MPIFKRVMRREIYMGCFMIAVGQPVTGIRPDGSGVAAVNKRIYQGKHYWK